MTLARRTQTQDKSAPAGGRRRLVRVRDDAGIEERGGFEGVLVEKIRPDQATLRAGEICMGSESFFHVISPRLEFFQQVAVSPQEVIKHIGKKRCRCLIIERQNPIDNIIRTDLVGWIKVPGFRRRFKRPHNYAGRIRAQM